jgi:SAM-dependent methyltransferase
LKIRLLFLLALAAAVVRAQSWAFDDGTTPYVQSPSEVVERMLQLAAPKRGERLIDLGSGDGRIVIEAAKRFGAQGLGVDIDPRLVRLARDNARKAGVESLARFEVQDLYETNLRDADIVTAYLLPDVNLKLMPRLLAQLRPGARIVTHDYDMGPWPYDEMIELPVAEKMVGPMGRSKVFLFFVPADVRGTWVSDIPGRGGRWEFDITQDYQLVHVKARAEEREQPVRGTRLRGEEIRLVVTGLVGEKPRNHLFRGVVNGARIAGELLISDGEETQTLPWTATRKQ